MLNLSFVIEVQGLTLTYRREKIHRWFTKYPIILKRETKKKSFSTCLTQSFIHKLRLPVLCIDFFWYRKLSRKSYTFLISFRKCMFQVRQVKFLRPICTYFYFCCLSTQHICDKRWFLFFFYFNKNKIKCLENFLHD